MGAGAGQSPACIARTCQFQTAFNPSATAMPETKPATQSITIVANVLTMVALLIGMTVKEFGPAEQATFVQAGSAIVAGGLQLVSIWGRVRATARIDGAFKN